ncbi:MAG: PDC sensor domain-containing protein [Desulfobacteraceae bacterium]|jgi:hypothetical protein
MKKVFCLLVAGMWVLAAFSAVGAAEKAPQKIVDLADSTLVKIGTDPVIVDAVKSRNAEGATMDQIKEMDAQWRDHAGVADYMQALMDSACGKHLKGIQDSASYYAEIFVMDNQGANVAMTNKTSDYWQGDEAKFQKSYNGGNGEVFVDEVEFDESAQAYLVQISVPVMDGGKAIGAITFGIDVEAVE